MTNPEIADKHLREYYIILRCVALRCIVLYRIVLYRIVSYHIIYYIIYHIILYYIILYYIHSIPPTYFGHTCVHPQGGELQRTYYKNILNNSHLFKVSRTYLTNTIKVTHFTHILHRSGLSLYVCHVMRILILKEHSFCV